MLLLCLVGMFSGSYALDVAESDPIRLSKLFREEVDMVLAVPAEQQDAYAALARQSLTEAGLALESSQYLVVVDRNAAVQSLLVFWWPNQGAAFLLGASPISTGKPGAIDHFVTPTGVFEHSLANLDFRAEGTKNEFGIMGYGKKGMRVFDFGWALAERGWGAKGKSTMRLQMHATDPMRLEHLLGRAQSKGCIRIPATLNLYLDRHGLIDADYDAAASAGQRLWVLRPDRVPAVGAGRYLIIVESAHRTRPAWSPLPAVRRRPPAAAR